MTNIPIRVLRFGEWKYVDIDDFTDAELKEYFLQISDTETLREFAMRLAKWIRENVHETKKPIQ